MGFLEPEFFVKLATTSMKIYLWNKKTDLLDDNSRIK